MSRSRWLAPLAIILGSGMIAGYLMLGRSPPVAPDNMASTRSQPGASTAAPLATAQLSRPTRTAEPVASLTPTSISVLQTPTLTGEIKAASPTAVWLPDRQRFGVAGGISNMMGALQAGLPVAHFVNWRVLHQPPNVPIAFWQMLRFDENGLMPALGKTWQQIEAIADANPGSTWIIGNEPDVRWQDGVTSEQYARHYHQAYTVLKARDPSAQVAIAGVSQPTPLRLAYLDKVLDSYQAEFGQPMPVDIWNVHAFILREERDSWGVDIPPGMDDANAMLYEVDDHAQIDIFRQNLINFRVWMADRGYQDRPLVVSEYGILMPEDFGFTQEVVADFMSQSFDFFLSETNESGYAADGGRLVQWWFWYSLYDGADFPTGNLYNPATGHLTSLGHAFAGYVNQR